MTADAASCVCSCSADVYDTIKTAAEITRPVRAETRCSAALLSVALFNTAPCEVRYIGVGKLRNIFTYHGF